MCRHNDILRGVYINYRSVIFLNGRNIYVLKQPGSIDKSSEYRALVNIQRSNPIKFAAIIYPSFLLILSYVF